MKKLYLFLVTLFALLLIGGSVATAAQPPLTAPQGGTGSTSPSGILIGDNGATLRLSTLKLGTCLSLSGITLTGTCAGTVTGVTAGNPLFSSGGATPNITTLFSTTTTFGLGNNGFLVTGATGIPFTAPSSTLSLPNAALQNSSVTINTSGVITGGGTVALGNALTITCASCSTSGYPFVSTVFGGGSIPVQSTSTAYQNLAGIYVSSTTDPISNMGGTAGIAGPTGSGGWPLVIANPVSTTGSSTGIGFVVSSSPGIAMGAGIGFVRQGAGSFGDLFFSTTPATGSNTERMRLTSTGNLGIGTTSPLALFTVATPPGASGAQNFILLVASSTRSATTTVFSIDHFGNSLFQGLDTIGNIPVMVVQANSNAQFLFKNLNGEELALKAQDTKDRIVFCDTAACTGGQLFLDHDNAGGNDATILSNSGATEFGIGNNNTPIATLDVRGTSSATQPLLIVSSSTVAGSSGINFEVDPNGHRLTGGASPSCGAGCGTVVGDDNNFRTTTGTGVTVVTVNFAKTWKNTAGTNITPVCNSSDESGGTTVSDASSTPTSVSMNLSASLTTKFLAVHCEASNNFTF